MRIISLGSGSKGNATLIESSSSRLLIDCGFSVKQLDSRLAQAGVDPDSIDAVLVTHEHQDHLRGAAAFARRHHAVLRGTMGTFRGVDIGKDVQFEPINSHAGSLQVAGFEVIPYPVPHDSREAVQFVIRAEDVSFGMLTDAGSITPHAVALLAECDALLLEFNHDEEMLRNGPYPWSLKKRVAGDLGHLSNTQSVGLLRQLDTSRLQHLLAAHLSDKNNHPKHVRASLAGVDEKLDDLLVILEQDRISDWFLL